MSLPKLDTPTYVLELPSTKKKVKYRPFLVREHKTLLTMSEASDDEITRIVKEVIDVCTFNKLDIDTLTHFDIEYIFLMLRAKSIGENVNVVMNCKCGNKVKSSYSIEDAFIERIEEHSNKVQITEKYGIEFSYPKIDDVIKIYSNKDTDSVIEMVMNSIKGIYSKDNYWDVREESVEDIKNFLYSLTKEQFTKVEGFFKTAPKVVQIIEGECDQCGEKVKSRVEGLSNFFV